MTTDDLLDGITMDAGHTGSKELVIFHPDEPGIQIELEFVTPQRAVQLLATNHEGQRRIAVPTVNKYAADMKRGTWQFAGDPVRLDIDGHIVDGQHRLYAIVEAEVGQWLLVISGLPNATMLAIDAGKKRSLANQLHMIHFRKTGEKLKNSVQVGALCSRMFFWDGGMYGTEHMARVPNPTVNRDQASHAQLISIKEKYETAYGITFEQAAGIGLAAAAKRPGIYSTNYSLVWTLLSGRNKNLREKFFFELMCDDPDVVISAPMQGFKNRMLRRGKHEVWSTQLQLHFLFMCAIAMGNDEESPSYRGPKVDRWEYFANFDEVPYGEAELAAKLQEVNA